MEQQAWSKNVMPDSSLIGAHRGPDLVVLALIPALGGRGKRNASSETAWATWKGKGKRKKRGRRGEMIREKGK